MSDALLFFVCLAAALCIRQFIGCAAVVKELRSGFLLFQPD